MYDEDDPRIYRPNEESPEEYEEEVILPSELNNGSCSRREIIRQRHF